MSIEKETLYTARWYAKEIYKKTTEPTVKKLSVELEAVITGMIEDGPAKVIPLPKPAPAPGPAPEKPAAAGSKSDWYPGAIKLSQKMPTHGTYANGWPRGAIVHFTSGRDGAEKTINGGIENGYAFLCIQEDGLMCQAHPLSKWGYHAGKSKWPGLDGTVSDELVGIEINNAGKVDKLPDGRYKTWFNTYIPESRIRYTKGVANQDKGYYHTYTAAQEKCLVEFLLWMKSQAPSIFSFDFVLGHDEVAVPHGRKTDPGASLSMTMPAFREHLKAEWAKRNP